MIVTTIRAALGTRVMPSSGSTAPAVKDRKLAAAACPGRASCSGSTPSSASAWVADVFVFATAVPCFAPCHPERDRLARPPPRSAAFRSVPSALPRLGLFGPVPGFPHVVACGSVAQFGQGGEDSPPSRHARGSPASAHGPAGRYGCGDGQRTVVSACGCLSARWQRRRLLYRPREERDA